ncbi:MAG: PcfB family protein [Clostridia bacterium]
MQIQDDLERKSLALSTNATKMTTRLLLKMMKKFLDDVKTPTITQGKQSLKQLAKQNQGMSSVEIDDSNIKSFEKFARKYGVDFALKKDDTQDPPKFVVFFKARDQDAITRAMTEFLTSQSKTKQSVIENLAEKENSIQPVQKVKNKEQTCNKTNDIILKKTKKATF